MAPRQTRRVVKSAAVVAAGVFAFRHWSGPAYAVKGTWEGAAGDLKPDEYGTVLKGLEPDVQIPAISFNREGLALSLEDGKLNADYTTAFGDGNTLNFNVNDEKAWKATLDAGDASLRVKGEGNSLDNLFWEASQSGHADIGDVLLEFNSDKYYNLTVSQPNLGSFFGANVGAKVRATNDGYTSAINAVRSLPQDAELSYSFENPVGVYDIDKAHHEATITAPVGGGKATVKMTREDSAQGYKASYSRDVAGGSAGVEVKYKNDAVGYNVSYARGLGDSLPVDANLQLGADEDGVYGELTANRDLGDAAAEYVYRGRISTGDDVKHTFDQHLKLSNKLGYAQILHGSDGGNPRVRLGYEFHA